MTAKNDSGLADAGERPAGERLERLTSELTELIYDASIEPGVWQLFIDTLCEACGGAAGAVNLTIAAPGATSYAFRRGLDPRYSGIINRHYARGLPWRHRDARYHEEFQLGSRFFPNEKLPETEFYREYMAPQKLAPECPMLFSLGLVPKQPTAAVILYRREGGRSLDERDVALCNSLVPHLKRAHEIHTRLHDEREQRRALSEVVDRFPMGVILVDEAGHCVSINASARRILDLDDGVRLDRNRPIVEDERRNEELHHAIANAASAARNDETAELHVIAVERRSGGEPFTLAVTPLRRPRNELSPGDAVAAVFLADPDSGTTNLPVLEELYGLTHAESALVGQLVTGRSVEEIAEIRNIRTSTARGYLKSIYRKTKTNSQRELVRLVLTGLSPMGSNGKARSHQ